MRLGMTQTLIGLTTSPSRGLMLFELINLRTNISLSEVNHGYKNQISPHYPIR